MKPVNFFYSEPDPDRWFKFDRYPRQVIRRIIRGKPRPGGVMQAAMNLIRGFQLLGIPFRYNDYSYINKHPGEIACILGKPHLIFQYAWKNPIIFGPGTFSHPIEYPDIFKRYPNIQRIVVFGEWMKKMFQPAYGKKVIASPVGTDTQYWDIKNKSLQFDFLIYDKIRWNYAEKEDELLNPLKEKLLTNNVSFHTIKYGWYTHEELLSKLKVSKAVIFLCEHETQGLAYQQILATNTPILAWDRGGYWQDPYYYPDKVVYGPVSSVPYWDERCGMKFKSADDFNDQLMRFLTRLQEFKPRQYIMENLTLEKCAEKYLEIYQEVQRDLK